MTRTVAFTLILWLGMAGAASAQWSVTVFGGGAVTSPGTLRLTSPSDDTAVTLDGVRYDSESLRSPIYDGVRITRVLEAIPWLGVEGELIHLKAIADTDRMVRADGRWLGQSINDAVPLAGVLTRFELSHGLNLVLANVVVRVPLGRMTRGSDRPRVAFTVRGGVGPTVPHVEAQWLDRRVSAYQLGRMVWQVAGGVDLRLARRLFAIGEFKWTGTRQQLDIEDADVVGSFVSRHLVLGLGWRFGSGSTVHRPFMRHGAS